MSYRHLPCWHPTRIQPRNPSFDEDNEFLYALFCDRQPRLSLWARAKALLRRELAPIREVLFPRVNK